MQFSISFSITTTNKNTSLVACSLNAIFNIFFNIYSKYEYILGCLLIQYHFEYPFQYILQTQIVDSAMDWNGLKIIWWLESELCFQHSSKGYSLTCPSRKKQFFVALTKVKNGLKRAGLRSTPSDSLTPLLICNDVCSFGQTRRVNSWLINL